MGFDSSTEKHKKGASTGRSPLGRIALRLLFSTKPLWGVGVLAEGRRQRAARGGRYRRNRAASPSSPESEKQNLPQRHGDTEKNQGRKRVAQHQGTASRDSDRVIALDRKDKTLKAWDELWSGEAICRRRPCRRLRRPGRRWPGDRAGRLHRPRRAARRQRCRRGR